MALRVVAIELVDRLRELRKLRGRARKRGVEAGADRRDIVADRFQIRAQLRDGILERPNFLRGVAMCRRGRGSRRWRRREQTADFGDRERAADRAEARRERKARGEQREAARAPLGRGRGRDRGAHARVRDRTFHARRYARRRAEDCRARQCWRLLARMRGLDAGRFGRHLPLRRFGRRSGRIRNLGRRRDRAFLGNHRAFLGDLGCACGPGRLGHSSHRDRLRGIVGLRRIPALLHGLVPVRIHPFVTMRCLPIG